MYVWWVCGADGGVLCFVVCILRDLRETEQAERFVYTEFCYYLHQLLKC